jgi:hypothetical protein
MSQTNILYIHNEAIFSYSIIGKTQKILNMKNYFLLLLILSLSYSAFAIDGDVDSSFIQEAEATMQGLIVDVLTNKNVEVREKASNELEETMEEILQKTGSYDYSFTALEGVSVQQPEDKAFRVFTWQLYVDKDSYQYRGFIQTKEGKVHRLKDNSDDMRTVEFSILKPENWYGALYYNLKEFQHDGQKMYMLFGYDAIDFYNKRKLLDVLYFDSSGRPRFGKTVIEMKDAHGRKRNVKRFLLEYSSSVNVTLNYSKEQDMIIYDHLIYGSPIKGGGPSNVPDGSYCGLKLTKDGTWEYVNKVHRDDPANILVDATSYEKMVNGAKSTPKKKEKDIFGRAK